ncbi:hypothetical protein ABMA27_006158 [Loxostege sticticalis]|uniref:Uncharacterized protein n=1 Tax=Loxostege sticticalis TaxID=481309 RepID=A0ABR3HHS6_LOXSC
MTLTRATLIILAFASLLTICNANMLEDFLEFIFGIKSNKRSMSELITGFLDEIFPKDDKDTEAMKNIFTMYNEDGNNLFSSQYSGMDYFIKKK